DPERHGLTASPGAGRQIGSRSKPGLDVSRRVSTEGHRQTYASRTGPCRHRSFAGARGLTAFAVAKLRGQGPRLTVVIASTRIEGSIVQRGKRVARLLEALEPCANLAPIRVA